MGSDYESGHLVKLYYTPVATPYTMEEVGNITGGDLESGFDKELTKIVVRGETVDSYFMNPVMNRDPWSFTVTVETDAQYAALRTSYLASTVHGWMQRGFDSTGAPSDMYHVVSGAIKTFKRVSPHETGPVRIEMSVQPSGLGILDGVSYGTLV